MDKSVKVLRNQYQQYYQLAHSNEIKQKKMSDIQQSKLQATAVVQSVQENGQFEFLEEANFYREKFEELEEAYKRAKNEKMKWGEFNPIVRDIFQLKEYVPGHSYIKSKPASNEVSFGPAIQNKLIASFFEEKKSKLVPDVGFKSLLENPPVTSKHFPKKAQSNKEEIDRLRAQNFDLRKKLESGEVSHIDHDKLKKHEDRIKELERENDALSRDNHRLRSEVSSASISTARPYEEQTETPYNLAPRQNDLYKINVRNYSETSTVEDRQFHEGDSFNMRALKNHGTYSSYSEHQGNDHNYSVFDMSKSYDLDHGDVSSSKGGIENSRAVGKNKIAFFKTSGVLIRDQEFEVAYKRTEPEEREDYSRVRINLYFNNKTGMTKSISISYDYERNYYELDVRETAHQINPFKQAREVIEVRLRPTASDNNSIIEAAVNLDGRHFNIWVPAMFIKVSPLLNKHNSAIMGMKTIYPHRYFRSSADVAKMMNLSIRDRDDVRLWGISKFEEGLIELHWKDNGKLVVRAPEKWVDFFSFVMFDFR